MPLTKLVTLILDSEDALAMMEGRRLFSMNLPLGLATIVGMAFTELNLLILSVSNPFAGNAELQREVEFLQYLQADFDQPRTNERTIHVLRIPADLNKLSSRVIEFVKHMSETGPELGILTTQLAVGLTAFVALHQLVVSREFKYIHDVALEGVVPLSLNTVLELLHALGTLCDTRSIAGDTIEWLVDVTVALVKVATPTNRIASKKDFRQRLLESPVLKRIVNVVLDNMMVETFRESRMWPSLVSLSDPVHVLEAQNLAAHIFLLTHGDTRLSPGQRRLLQLRPKLRAHLKASCACGCKKPPSETSNFCSGCKRAYYVSKQCQTDAWHIHRDTCVGIWQVLRRYLPVPEMTETDTDDGVEDSVEDTAAGGLQ